MTEVSKSCWCADQYRHISPYFKLGGAYYFKHFFDDAELFRELEPYYEKQRYRFRIAAQELSRELSRDKIVLVMKDMAWVKQAVAMGAVVRGGKRILFVEKELYSGQDF